MWNFVAVGARWWLQGARVIRMALRDGIAVSAGSRKAWVATRVAHGTFWRRGSVK